MNHNIDLFVMELDISTVISSTNIIHTSHILHIYYTYINTINNIILFYPTTDSSYKEIILLKMAY